MIALLYEYVPKYVCIRAQNMHDVLYNQLFRVRLKFSIEQTFLK